ncbi:hypothetical protein, partial [Pseudomonas aeruginosa]|uniref:hypothetical protein n=1 Tax=Pseudomonas aeruginosa TaxID=287 RepID=UPI001ED98F99
PGALGYLMQRQLVAEIHPANFAHHFHTDHPVFSCSKIEQKQLNTWVSFQSAEQPLLGQFSVSGNIGGISRNSRSNCRDQRAGQQCEMDGALLQFSGGAEG